MAMFNFLLCITCWQLRGSRENERGRVGGMEGRKERGRECERERERESWREGGKKRGKGRGTRTGGDWREPGVEKTAHGLGYVSQS